MTAKQLTRHLEINATQCASILGKLARRGLVACLNPGAASSRVYGLTKSGQACQRELCRIHNRAHCHDDVPDVDWALYGWVCFRHRSAILRALSEPLQPAAVKRRIRTRDPRVRISANNVRDVMRLLHARGIVCTVSRRRKKHRLYKLTDLGDTLRRLLIQAETIGIDTRRISPAAC